MTKIAFTLCSNNYLGQASLLAASFMKHNKDYHFYIGLIDQEVSSVRYPQAERLHVLPVDKVIPAAQLASMAAVYKIVELNTSAKPFYFNYFFSQYEQCDVIYLDPDIYVYNSFSEVDERLNDFDFVITPHILSPIPLDGLGPQERSFMKYGTYNLGFIAMRKSEQSIAYVNWLQDRLAVLCYSEVNLGVYVDQSWVNFLPIFFKKVHVSHHPGLNAAFWNLHERQYSQQNGVYYINGEYPLVFFHFSSFRIGDWQNLAANQNRYTVHNRPDIKGLFEQYGVEFAEARKQFNASIECIYTKRNWKQKIAYYLNRYRIRKELAL